MRRFHVIAGLPRSGSTLLCNILNQNPKFFASSTSALPGLLSVMSEYLAGAPEVKSDLNHDHQGTEQQLASVFQSAAMAWYVNESAEVVIDKSRLWAFQADLLFRLFPRAKMVVCVRDLLEVFASVERHRLRNPMLAAGPRTAFARADQMFSPGGMIGGPLMGLEDLRRRELPGVVFLQYESLVAHPEEVMRALYDRLEEPWHEHDFDNVENVATDLDALYLHRFPHEGKGKVEPRKESGELFVDRELRTMIDERFAAYNATFGYRQEGRAE